MGNQEWISVQQAADIMGVTEIWVLRRLHDGTLPGFKINAKAWCVSKKACLKDAQDYVKNKSGRVGRPRSRAS